MYVGGSWVESESGERLEAISPATGETIGSVPEATRDDTRRAIGLVPHPRLPIVYANQAATEKPTGSIS